MYIYNTNTTKTAESRGTDWQAPRAGFGPRAGLWEPLLYIIIPFFSLGAQWSVMEWHTQQTVYLSHPEYRKRLLKQDKKLSHYKSRSQVTISQTSKVKRGQTYLSLYVHVCSKCIHIRLDDQWLLPSCCQVVWYFRTLKIINWVLEFCDSTH